MKKYLLLIVILILPIIVMAQNKITISGNITSASDSEPLIGVSILEVGTTNAAISDIDGNYKLSVNAGSTIKFSMISFTSQEIKVTKEEVRNIAMKEDTELLEEVVVIGYGTVKKSDLTSSITTVKGDDLKSMTTGNALNSLQGKANGVQIVSGGGPGATPQVVIRGITSINGSDPLYVVDGVPMGGNINFLNQDDIQSIEVLKDASSAAIYGTRGLME